MKGQPIVIDAGHGGSSPVGHSTPFGVRGPSGTCEKDVVLELARRVATHLGTGEAVLTRNEDVNLPLSQRIAVARRYGAPVFVSIHANEGRGSGAKAFVHRRAGASSRRLARAIEAELAVLGGAQAHPVHEAELAVLTPERLGPSTAACLLEVDHLSEPEGERRLRDPHALERISRAIARGIQRYGDQPGRRDEALEVAVVIGIVGLGLAVFSLANALEARAVGGLTWRRNVTGCRHTYAAGQTPGPWVDRTLTVLNVDCTAGLSGVIALFGLNFRCNGNDIDQCYADKYNSSDWTISKLDVTFEGQAAPSYEQNSVGTIMLYLTGTLDPTGSGDIDFAGNILIKADGSIANQGALQVTRGDASAFEIGGLYEDRNQGFYIKKL